MKGFIIMCLFCVGLAQAQSVYAPADLPHSVTFRIRNFGIMVSGSLSGLTGEIRFDPENPDKGSFVVSVRSASVQTGVELRDRHLRKEEFLDAETHPIISFNSTQVRKGSRPNEWNVEGDLTLKGVVKGVVIPFSVEKSGSANLVFSGEFMINRREFGVGGRSIGMADEVLIKLQVPAHSISSP